jgi:hypothetical protein
MKDMIRPFFGEERLQTECDATFGHRIVQPEDLLVLIEVFDCDGNLAVSALLEFHFITVLVG